MISHTTPVLITHVFSNCVQERHSRHECPSSTTPKIPNPPQDRAEATSDWKEELQTVARDAFSFMAAGQRAKVNCCCPEEGNSGWSAPR